MDYVLLGQRIRAARLSAGISQEQLAEMIGLTSQHISHPEVASTKSSLPSLVKIAMPCIPAGQTALRQHTGFKSISAG